MDLKKKVKGFFTLKTGANDGFTLVELIVVIAILAILGGVAVPAYGGYVTKANKQADISLASEVEQALILAHYNQKLTPGDYVVVKYDGTVEVGNSEDSSVTTADAAMIATFGSGYADTLRLKYEGWAEEIGVAGDAATMQIVKDSNFSYDNLDSLLSQVQLVVDEAGGYFSKGNVAITNDSVVDILNSAGVAYTKGELLDSTNATAAANAYVYYVGSELAGLDLTMDDDITDTEAAFYEAWLASDFSNDSLSSLDNASTAAAQYASIYALATYIDEQTKDTVNATSYAARIDAAGDPRVVANSVLSDIKNDSSVSSIYSNYTSSGNAYNDAQAFIAYMSGLTDNTNSLLGSTDLTQADYFTSNDIASYVQNYIDIGTAMSEDGGFVFIYDGEKVVSSRDYLNS